MESAGMKEEKWEDRLGKNVSGSDIRLWAGGVGADRPTHPHTPTGAQTDRRAGRVLYLNVAPCRDLYQMASGARGGPARPSSHLGVCPRRRVLLMARRCGRSKGSVSSGPELRSATGRCQYLKSQATTNPPWVPGTLADDPTA